MVDVAETAGPIDRLHTLLLALTGRIDDDGIDSARELLGLGLPDAAAEFIAGCLIAGRIQVSGAEQHHLRRVLAETRSLPDLADRLAVVDSVLLDEHRFDKPERDVAERVEEALASVGSRLDGVRGLWVTLRTTPAGTSYGAVPRQVLLAEVTPGGTPAAVGYQLIAALRRAGLACSVDVFESGMELPNYQRDALSAAQTVQVAGGASAPAPKMTKPAEPVVERPVERPVEREEPVRREPVPPMAPQLEPEPLPEATAEPPLNPAVQAAMREAEETGVMMKVPPAVDAKLTDRERNLLRKLHEELAQREQTRGGKRRPSASSEGEDSWTSTMPGGATGGFPPITQNRMS